MACNLCIEKKKRKKPKKRQRCNLCTKKTCVCGVEKKKRRRKTSSRRSKPIGKTNPMQFYNPVGRFMQVGQPSDGFYASMRVNSQETFQARQGLSVGRMPGPRLTSMVGTQTAEPRLRTLASGTEPVIRISADTQTTSRPAQPIETQTDDPLIEVTGTQTDPPSATGTGTQTQAGVSSMIGRPDPIIGVSQEQVYNQARLNNEVERRERNRVARERYVPVAERRIMSQNEERTDPNALDSLQALYDQQPNTSRVGFFGNLDGFPSPNVSLSVSPAYSEFDDKIGDGEDLRDQGDLEDIAFGDNIQ